MLILESGSSNLLMLISATNPMPLSIADNPIEYKWTDDHRSILALDDFDPTSQTAVLKVASFPGGTVTILDPSASPQWPSFAHGTELVLEFLSTDTVGQTGDPIVAWEDNSPTVVAPNVLSFITVADPPKLYFTAANPIAIFARPLP